MRSISTLVLATSLASSVSASETINYGYDSLGRVTSVSRSGTVNNGVATAVSYDNAGNRSSYGVQNAPAKPGVSISDASATEGGTLVFTVSLSAPSGGPVIVAYSAASGTATVGSDFAANSGRLTFAPGETSKTISVATVDDALIEGNETFTVNLSEASGGTISRASGTGTIVDNDFVQVTFAVANAAAVDEGSPLIFTVTKSNVTTATTSVSYATANGSAAAGSDYVATSGTLTFGPGEYSKTVSVATIDDTSYEADETVLLNLNNPTGGTISVAQASGTIKANDMPPMTALNPSLGFSSASVTSIPITTLVNLSGNSATIVSFSLPANTGSATIAADGQSVTYTAESIPQAAACEPGTKDKFTVPYSVRANGNGAITNGTASFTVSGPAGPRKVCQ
ncbi:Calx-beta domain-containing protein [Novosphingobium sp. PhB165]|nr:Calx-beta domain-containing protein [Novosphingobium sp. PhB165]